MALLTADDVLNKAFSKTKYREGFDQDEVDDFLDEVAGTIAQLTAERDELAARLQAAPASAPASAPTPEAPPVTAAGGVPGTSGLLAAATDPNAPNPTGMLAMAQKLHDEYVHAGEAERERIIDEANVAADKIRERAEADAQTRMDELTGERAGLEAKIDDLRRFERDYRARLRAYLENLLGDLEHSGSGTPPPPAVLPDSWASDADEGSAAAAAPDAAAEVFAAEGFGSAAPAPEAPAEAPAEDDADDAGPRAVYDEVTVVETYDADGEVDSVEVEETVVYEAQAPAAPAYDPDQPWESQLTPGASPFAPVSEPAAPAEASQPPAQSAPDAADVPPVETGDSEEAPFTPPSSRMFSDIFNEQRKKDEA